MNSENIERKFLEKKYFSGKLENMEIRRTWRNLEDFDLCKKCVFLDKGYLNVEKTEHKITEKIRMYLLQRVYPTQDILK